MESRLKASIRACSIGPVFVSLISLCPPVGDLFPANPYRYHPEAAKAVRLGRIPLAPQAAEGFETYGTFLHRPCMLLRPATSEWSNSADIQALDHQCAAAVPVE